MVLSMIVAKARNGVIGRDNKMPWHLPEDLKYFKRVTMGKPVIMGRKTYQSIGRALPGRLNIVITQNPDFSAEDVRVAASVEEAIVLAQQAGGAVEEVMIIGGAQVYRQALARADRLYITEVDVDIEGDACFPELDFNAWSLLSREDCPAQPPNPYSCSFLVYQRVVQ